MILAGYAAGHIFGASLGNSPHFVESRFHLAVSGKLQAPELINESGQSIQSLRIDPRFLNRQCWRACPCRTK
jgi:hypothetical protein